MAELAERNLTLAAREEVRLLLQDDLDRDGAPSGRKSLAAVASWPDEIRELNASAYRGWHSRANSVCDGTLGGCKGGRCVDQNLIGFAAVLQDHSLPIRMRNEALKWVVHLVGDLHQPLHSGSIPGGDGFAVVLEGRDPQPTTASTLSFHQAWDSALVKSALKEGPLEGKLDSAPELPVTAPTEWMIETQDIARAYAYEPLPGFVCGRRPEAPVTLDMAYQRQAILVVRERMQQAGLRLAQLLNQVLR